MRPNPIFTIIIISLVSLGSWGVWKITSDNSPSVPPKTHITKTSRLVEPQSKPIEIKLNNQTQNTTFNDEIARVSHLLSLNEFNQAMNYVDELYSDLDSEQLVVLKNIFIKVGLQHSDNGNLKKAQRLYLASASLFDGVDILDLLSGVSVELNDWQTAFDSLLKSSLLESNPDAIGKKLTNLTIIAAQLKTAFIASSDLESARKLYQSLYEAHSSYAQFQLELALIHLAQGNVTSAKQLLNDIQYDIEVGGVAQQQLALLEKQETTIAEQQKTQQPEKINNDIRVPLVRAGNSFLVDSVVNGKKARLLLDTGASITALSPEVISRLQLSPTGQAIRLSTANGVTESQLFLAKKITIGKITVRDLVVAEINLDNNQRFQGLLGTDLLNKVGSNYSYLIDNENNALIFRRKNR